MLVIKFLQQTQQMMLHLISNCGRLFTGEYIVELWEQVFHVWVYM